MAKARGSTPEELQQLLSGLRDSQSAKRRASAKKLRAIASPAATLPLCEALQAEVRDRRTWETQYQMVMALADCGRSSDAQGLVESLFALDLEPMVHLAAGDAAVRLSPELDPAVLAALNSGSLERAEGAIRALAMTRAVPSEAVIRSVLSYAQHEPHRQVRFWVAAAAPGWPRILVESFLVACLSDGDAETKRAAQAALDGRYLRWNPL